MTDTPEDEVFMAKKQAMREEADHLIMDPEVETPGADQAV